MTEPEITITLNGEPVTARASELLEAFLVRQGEPIQRAVVEHNGRYVSHDSLGEVRLEAGDRVEVILPAFGG